MIRRTLAFTSGLMLLLPLASFAQSNDTSGERAIAERLAKIAQLSLVKPEVGDDNFRQAAALLQAACRLNPAESRFSRLLVEAQLQLGNNDGAIEALELYLKANPRDQVARLQLVDLFASQMETAERRLAYFTQDLLPIQSLPPEFRSAIAVRAAKLYLDRDQQGMASAMIDQAISLNPVNPEARELDWEGTKHSGTTAEKVAALLGMLRANPAQPEVMNLLATVLSTGGYHEQAQRWWAQSFDITPKLGRPLSKEVTVEAAASSFILGQTKTAESRVMPLIEFDPSNYDAHLIRILAARRLGSPEVGAKATETAIASVAARINTIHRELTNEDSPTTKPSGEVAELIPDPAAVAPLLKDKVGTPIADAYTAAWSDLALVSLLYSSKPADANPLIDALRAVLPADSVVLARLEGLQLAQAQSLDEAKTKLSSIADRDPIARMALIRLQAADDKSAASTAAGELLDRHRAGLLGAILVDGFSQLDVRFDPPADEASAVNAELDRFPSDWMRFLDKPQDFYSLTAGSDRVPFAFGEPIIVTVDLKNISPMDIALTAGGAIRPDLWFDCSMRGVQQQQVPGVAFERFGQALVLRPGQSISHTARIDQGQLWQMLQQNPAVSFPLFFTVFTNPVPTAMIAGPGPGGYRYTLRAIERQPVSLSTPGARDEIFRALSLGTSGDKIRTQEMLAQYSGLISRQPDAPPESAAMVDELRQAIEQGMSDTNPLVRAFATYVISQIAGEPRRSELSMRMANSSDWVQRMLVITTVEGLAPELRSELLGKLSTDDDALVRQLAEATAAYAERVPPATQPSADSAATPPAGN